MLAWVEGCPIPKGVISRKGIPGAIVGYTDVLSTRLHILRSAQIYNSSLYHQMIVDTKRSNNEPVGLLHESESVPKSYLRYIPANDSTCGYSVPRSVLTVSSNIPKETMRDVLHNIQVIKPIITEVDKPLLLVALAAEELATYYPNKVDDLIRFSFSRGHFQEQNNLTTFQELFGLLEIHAPTLFRRYGKLSPDEKAEKGIADIDKLK
jgi:hypothetical protein